MQIMQYVSIMYFCFFLNFLYCRKYTKVFQKQNIIADMSWTASQKMTCRQHPRHHPHRIASVNRASCAHQHKTFAQRRGDSCILLRHRHLPACIFLIHIFTS